MPKRTLAALLALLVAASTLAVVAQPAAAHSQTTTKQRCSYDPFAGRQCWTETVTVAHTHSCGAGMTGTYPNCYPIPPANQNCGAGTTGTYPNCYPIPPDNKNSDDSGGDDDDGGGTDSTNDNSGDDDDDSDGTDDSDPDGDSDGTDDSDDSDGTDDSDPDGDSDGDECPAGQTGTPPNCKSDRYIGPEPCPAGTHRNLNNRYHGDCHPDHPDPPCGTGTWRPDITHAPVRQTPCDPTIRASKCPHRYALSDDGKYCELQGAVRVTRNIRDIVLEVEGDLVCTFAAGGIATKTVNAIAKNLDELSKFFLGWAFEQPIQHPCDNVWKDMTDWLIARTDTRRPNMVIPDTDCPKGTRACREAQDTDDSDSDDSDSDDTDDDGAQKVPTKEQMVRKNQEVQAKKDAGTLTPEERAEWKEMHRIYTCATNPAVQNTDWCKS